MRKLLRILAWLIAVCLVLVAGLVGVAWHLLGDMCRNEVLAEIRSPDGELNVVVFQRDCGATTGFSTQLSILPSGAELEDAPGNVLIADANHGAAPSGPGGGPAIRARWLNSQELQIVHHPKTRLFLAETESSGVRVSYKPEE